VEKGEAAKVSKNGLEDSRALTSGGRLYSWRRFEELRSKRDEDAGEDTGRLK